MKRPAGPGRWRRFLISGAFIAGATVGCILWPCVAGNSPLFAQAKQDVHRTQNKTANSRKALPRAVSPPAATPPAPVSRSRPAVDAAPTSPKSKAAPGDLAAQPVPPELRACVDDMLAVVGRVKSVGEPRLRDFLTFDSDLRARIRKCYPRSEDEADFFHGMAFADLHRGWVVGWNGKILSTTDGGAHWLDQVSGTTVHLLAVRFTDSVHGYVTGFDGTVLRTADGGKHWEPAAHAGRGALWSLSCLERTTCWTSGNTEGAVYGTRDGGVSWEERWIPTLAPIRGLQFLDPQHGFAAAMDGTVLATEDGGQTWETRLVRPSSRFFALWFFDRLNGWVVGIGAILRTRDGGRTWEDQTRHLNLGSISPDSLGFNAVAFTDANHGWAAGALGMVISTSDGGTTWRVQQPPLNYETTIYAISAQNRALALAAGNLGNIFATVNGGRDWLPVRGPARDVPQVIAQYLMQHADTPAPTATYRRETTPGDPTQWPYSAMGSLWISGSLGEGCSATLVAPRVVVTAARCLVVGTKLVSPANLHFTGNPAQGLSALHSGVERYVVAPDFDPNTWRATEGGVNWALLVLKELLPLKPIPVIDADQIPLERLGAVTEAGYSITHPYMPSVTQNCRVSSRSAFGTFVYDCLTHLALSGAAVLANVEGHVVLVGIASGLSNDAEPILMSSAAASASMFMSALAKLAQP